MTEYDYDRPIANQTAANTEMLLAFDEQGERYLWFHVGWQGNKRVRGIPGHVRIKNNKISPRSLLALRVE